MCRETLFAYLFYVFMFVWSLENQTAGKTLLEFRANALLSLDCHGDSMVHPPTITPYIRYDAEKVFLCIYQHILYHNVFSIHFHVSITSKLQFPSLSINMGEILSYYKKVVMLLSGLS